MGRRSLVEVVVISHDGLLVVEVVEIDKLAELGYKGLNNIDSIAVGVCSNRLK